MTTTNAARLRIVQEANRHILSTAVKRKAYIPPTLLSARHIQRAVCIVRRNKLVPPSTLELAGFRSTSR